jgi:hypothetical protein
MSENQDVTTLYNAIVWGEISCLDFQEALSTLYQAGIFVGENDREPSFENALEDILCDLKL